MLQELNIFSDRYRALIRPLRLGLYEHPANMRQERERLFTAFEAGQSYNPQFTYTQFKGADTKPLENLRDEVDPSQSVWHHILYDKIDVALRTIAHVDDHDPIYITETTLGLFGPVTEELLQDANNILGTYPRQKRKRTITAIHAADKLKRKLAAVGLTGWSVKLSPRMHARMMVRSSSQEIVVRLNSRFSKKEMRRLMVHEIGTHVFRAANGAAQPVSLLRTGGYPGYTLTEEGMATYHEMHYGLQDTNTLRRYALRVLAADISQQGTFFDVFAELIKHTSRGEAFQIARRAKRGFADTAQPGVHIKDKVYLEGFQQVRDHLQEHPEDYPLLMSGKVALWTLPALRELDWHPPRYLPDMVYGA